MRSENSGLIDLDALLKEASSGELPKSADDSLEAITTVPESRTEVESAPAIPVPTPTLPSASTATPPAPSPSSPSPPPKSEPKVAPAPPPREKPRAAPPRRRRSPAPWLALAAALGTIAFFVGFKRPQESPTAIPLPDPRTPTSIAAAASPTPVATGVSLDTLPVAVASASASASASAAAPVHAAAPVVAAKASAELVAIADAPQANTGDLGGAMREAVGPRASAEIANVDPTSGGSARQLKPSPGAVVGAINSVLPEARACLLTADDPPRAATIVFRSDGTVARVDLPAPARLNDECIRTALSKARTMPFVEDTFAARATVRP